MNIKYEVGKICNSGVEIEMVSAGGDDIVEHVINAISGDCPKENVRDKWPLLSAVGHH